MRKRMITVVAAAAGAALVAGGTVAAVAASNSTSGQEGSSDSSTPITGAALDSATAAAIKAAGPGTVTESEAGGDEAAYEVELKLDAGGSVDVRLDSNFAVIEVAPNSDQGEHADHSGTGVSDGDGETADDPGTGVSDGDGETADD